jgi:hypothetical protein
MSWIFVAMLSPVMLSVLALRLHERIFLQIYFRQKTLATVVVPILVPWAIVPISCYAQGAKVKYIYCPSLWHFDQYHCNTV